MVNKQKASVLDAPVETLEAPSGAWGAISQILMALPVAALPPIGGPGGQRPATVQDVAELHRLVNGVRVVSNSADEVSNATD